MPLPAAVTTSLYRGYAAASPWYAAGRLGAWRQILARAEGWSADEREAWQRALLSRLLRGAVSAPFWADRLSAAGIDPRAATAAEQLQRLPVLTKAEVRRAPVALLVSEPPPFRPGATSGTTGSPMRVRTTAEMDAAGRAARWRMFGWYGVPFGAPTLAFKGGNQQRGLGLGLTWALARELLGQTIRDAFRFPAAAQLELLRRTAAPVVVGYPNVLLTLGEEAQAAGLRLDRLGTRLVVLGGESISAEQRRAVSSAFACPVAALYGSHEGHYMAMECPSGRLHVQETVLLEVVDDEGCAVPRGTEGEVVVTPLLGAALPLLRYQLGDRGRLFSDACACGRSTSSLALDVTRTADLMLLGDGRRVSSQLFQPLIHNALGLRFGVDPRAYRVVQTAPDELEFQLSFARGARLPAGAAAFVDDQVRRALGPRLATRVVEVAVLPADRSGKRRCFIPLAEAERYRVQIG